MRTIDQLIFDALVQRQNVVLAGLGTIEVKRRGARRISETQMEPPRNEVVFNPDEVEGSHSVVSLIMAEGGMREPEAVAVYGAWLEDALHPDGTVFINEVGEMGDGRFNASEELKKALNPTNEKIMSMETKKGTTPMWVWIVIAVLAALLIAAGIFFGLNYSGFFKKQAVETVVTSTSPEADSLAAAETLAAESASQANNDTYANNGTSNGRFHIIAGAFSVESNADNLVTRLRRDYPELTPRKMVNPSSGYYMVSILSAPTLREASNKMNLYWDINLNLWVYEQR
jgi:hypothetical protein